MAANYDIDQRLQLLHQPFNAYLVNSSARIPARGQGSVLHGKKNGSGLVRVLLSTRKSRSEEATPYFSVLNRALSKFDGTLQPVLLKSHLSYPAPNCCFPWEKSCTNGGPS